MRDLRVSFPKPCDEPWDTMAPAGCDRVCARCDKVIYDLAHYSIDEAEALMRRDPDTCVRARIGENGVVALKPSPNARIRRTMIAMCASAGLLMTGTPVGAKDVRPTGAIAGKLTYFQFKTTVVATGADGRAYRSRVRGDGKYAIKHLPAGEYTLTFSPSCGEPWTLDNKVVVTEVETAVPQGPAEGECIIIGQLRIENNEA